MTGTPMNRGNLVPLRGNQVAQPLSRTRLPRSGTWFRALATTWHAACLKDTHYHFLFQPKLGLISDGTRV